MQPGLRITVPCRWLCSPKGTAFLWVKPHAQPGLAPLVTSHGYKLVSYGEVDVAQF